jgi:hypothetical protein
MSTEGLTAQDYRTFRDLLIKANETQLQSMMIGLRAEQRKRYEVHMAVVMGKPYGNQYIKYRLANGKRTQG